MLIDSKHQRWFLWTFVCALLAVGLHGWLGRSRPGGLTGGTAVGLWYGFIGTGLMIYAGLLASHRRLAAIRRLPMRRWLGTRQTWLRGHIWLGLLSVVFILCHSGYSWGGPLEILMWVVLGITIVSGVVGLVLQAILPAMITRRIPYEAPYEQIPHLCDLMGRDADETLVEATSSTSPGPTALEALKGLHVQVRAFLAPDFDARAVLASPAQARAEFNRVRAVPGAFAVESAIARLEQLCEERRQMGEQARMHRVLHFWLLIHVPITLALLLLGIVHAVTAVYW